MFTVATHKLSLVQHGDSMSGFRSELVMSKPIAVHRKAFLSSSLSSQHRITVACREVKSSKRRSAPVRRLLPIECRGSGPTLGISLSFSGRRELQLLFERARSLIRRSVVDEIVNQIRGLGRVLTVRPHVVNPCLEANVGLIVPLVLNCGN